MYRIPIYTIRLVREASLASAERNVVNNAMLAANVLRQYLTDQDRENFVVLLLNTKNCLISINTVSVGHLNAAIVHPREVFKPAILANSAVVILGHNLCVATHKLCYV